ncbi:flagellar assembly protein A [Alicyclobacillus kakegawensis]|uniref:flagellar assembly protein A n=1 Tax=Alicyclobacillus kakegawensis TaxID=392012 RepID=UPI0009F93978|nr:flagellar assembly protein A [Alicyclobacillus kakegawensis]
MQTLRQRIIRTGRSLLTHIGTARHRAHPQPPQPGPVQGAPPPPAWRAGHTLAEAETAPESSRPRHGRVSVAGRRIVVEDPDESGDFAILKVPEHPLLSVLVDGSPVVGDVVVHQSQRIELVTRRQPGRRSYRLSITPDNLAVIVKAEVEPGLCLHIPHQPPQHIVQLVVEERPVSPTPDHPDVIRQMIDKKGLQGDIDEQAILEITSAAASTERVILRGRPAQLEQPARYEAVTLPVEYDVLLRRKRLQTVPAGATLAHLVPGVPGVPGRDVFGRVIPAHVPTRLPALGQNVVEVGGRVVAVASGRPVVDTERIDVIPELTLEHDIGRNDGVIEFDGHVTIHGSVLEGSILRVRGQLVVHGDVVASTAHAGEGVWGARQHRERRCGGRI